MDFLLLRFRKICQIFVTQNRCEIWHIFF